MGADGRLIMKHGSQRSRLLSQAKHPKAERGRNDHNGRSQERDIRNTGKMRKVRIACSQTDPVRKLACGLGQTRSHRWVMSEWLLRW